MVLGGSGRVLEDKGPQGFLVGRGRGRPLACDKAVLEDMEDDDARSWERRGPVARGTMKARPTSGCVGRVVD